MTRSQKILQGNLLIRPILDALVCIWTGMVICWPHKAGLILEVAVEASRAIHNLREWAGYPARWRSKVISLSEANMTLAGCKQLKRERYR